jgi:CubicO group peptidase (beta-lactamase class C family)
MTLRTSAPLVLVAAAVCMGSCGKPKDGSPTGIATPPASVLTAISVTLTPSSIMVGQTATAVASGTDQNGNPIGTGAVTWSTTPGSVATVDAGGVVTGSGVGQTQVVASAGGKLGQQALTVNAPVASLALSVSGLPTGVGAALELTYPDGSRKQYTAGTSIAGLTPGAYVLTASAVRDGTARYAPSVASQTITLIVGDSRNVAVTYAVRSNALNVEVVGLPTGTAGNVELRGDTVVRTLSASGTMQDVPVGTYALNVKEVGASQRWYPSAATQTVTIGAGTPATLRARYLEFPVSGTAVAEFDSIDVVISNSLKELGFRTATVAVSRGTNVLYARGFGWKNAARTDVIQPNAILRTASNTKMLAMACIQALIREGKLTLTSKVFPLLAIAPSGPVGDPRLNDITVNQLLEHSGGWDGSISGDFQGLIWPAARALGKQTITMRDAVSYLQTRPLDFTPGTKQVYSNVGYMVLAVLIEHLSGKTFIEYLRSAVLPADLVNEFIAAREFAVDADPREPDYVSFNTACSIAAMLSCVRVPASYGGLGIELSGGAGSIAFSAPGVVKYATQYWGWGDRRNPPGSFGSAQWTFYGGCAGTMSIFRQMPNGVNFVVLYNQNPERENTLSETVQQRVESALLAMTKWPTAEVVWR